MDCIQMIEITAYACLLLLFFLPTHQDTALSLPPHISVAVHSTSDFVTCPALQETGESEVSD